MLEKYAKEQGFSNLAHYTEDTKGMNRILAKPLKTRDSGTLGVAGIPCLLLGCARVGSIEKVTFTL